MREILFRGWFECITGDSYWVYGYLNKQSNGNWEIINRENEWTVSKVSQFTGLLDKNGKRIFEGDILKLTYDGHSFNCEVKYSDGGFLVYENNGFNSGDADMTLIGWLKHDDYRYEVIGNIHDSPNLLK